MHICLSHCLPAPLFSIQQWPIAPCHTILHLSGLKSNYHFNLLSAFVHAWVYLQLTQVPAACVCVCKCGWWDVYALMKQWGACIQINESWICNNDLIMMQHLKHEGFSYFYCVTFYITLNVKPLDLVLVGRTKQLIWSFNSRKVEGNAPFATFILTFFSP